MNDLNKEGRLVTRIPCGLCAYDARLRHESWGQARTDKLMIRRFYECMLCGWRRDAVMA